MKKFVSLLDPHPAETINGRTAMLGVVIGLIYEKVTGELFGL